MTYLKHCLFVTAQQLALVLGELGGVPPALPACCCMIGILICLAYTLGPHSRPASQVQVAAPQLVCAVGEAGTQAAHRGKCQSKAMQGQSSAGP